MLLQNYYKKTIFLNMGQMSLDMIDSQVQKHKRKTQFPVLQHQIWAEQGKVAVSFAPDWIFESGFIKIQEGRANNLTTQKEEACQSLLKHIEKVQQAATNLSAVNSPEKMSEYLHQMMGRAEKRSGAIANSNEDKDDQYYCRLHICINS